DSLDLSLSLDSDLGVDSIKRVEILSAIREKLPDAPEVKSEHLGTLHTLKDVADFLAGSSAENAPATTKIPILDMSAGLLTKQLTSQMEVAEGATDQPDTALLSDRHPPKVPESAWNVAKKGNGSGGAPPAAPRQSLETARQPVSPFGSER